MKIKWITEKDDYKVETAKLMIDGKSIIQIEKYPDEEFCMIWTNQNGLQFLLGDIKPIDNIKDAIETVNKRIEEFCEAFTKMIH